MENQTKKRALVVFVREPELGTVKTRLQKSGLDEVYVLDLYKAFVKDVLAMAFNVSCEQVFIYMAYHQQQTGFFEEYNNRAQLKYQEGAHLGERMHNAFMDCFIAGYNEVVIIGSDCLMINALDIQESFVALDHADCVVGPSQDGAIILLV